MVVSYAAGCTLFDVETAQVVSRFEGDVLIGINRIVAHPILPLIIAACEDRHIRFYDHRTADVAHAMVAHLDAVTSLAVDPSGLYLLSGSKSCHFLFQFLQFFFFFIFILFSLYSIFFRS